MAEAVRLGDVVAGAPIRTGWSAPHGPPPEGGSLDQLTDVSGAGDGDPGSVLVKGSDGVWRSQSPPPAPPAWGEPTRYRRGEPNDSGPVGAVHVDLVTGRLWRFIETEG